MRRLGLAVLLLALPHPAPAQTIEEVDFAKELFRQIQPLSFAKRREYCGFIGRDADGALTATEPFPGNRDSCDLEWPRDLEVIASYHTHGAFDFGYENELPSLLDMESDADLGVDGWIATPGGRLWFVDGDRMVAKLVCAPGCLPVAPGFTKARGGAVAKAYTYDELAKRLSP